MAKFKIQDVVEQEEDTLKDKYLTFQIGKDSYGVEIKFVIEIIGIQAITEVPEMPPFIKGIINLRGEIIPVMDVRLRFKKAEKEYDDRTCIIVIDIEDIVIGLIVDNVSEVINIPESNIALPPDVDKTNNRRYLKGIGNAHDEIKLILNCEQLLVSEELDALENIENSENME